MVKYLYKIYITKGKEKTSLNTGIGTTEKLAAVKFVKCEIFFNEA